MLAWRSRKDVHLAAGLRVSFQAMNIYCKLDCESGDKDTKEKKSDNT